MQLTERAPAAERLADCGARPTLAAKRRWSECAWQDSLARSAVDAQSRYAALLRGRSMTATQRLRRWSARWLAPVPLTAAHLVGTLFRRPRLRALTLPQIGERHLQHGDLASARRIADELLRVAALQPPDWNTGNALHHGHLLLGRAALAEGNIPEAADQLLAAGRTPGSPQLNSFGPNCRLALDLLKAGQSVPVLAYLEACATFWKMDFGRLATWSAAIREDRLPEFGPNLHY